MTLETVVLMKKFYFASQNNITFYNIKIENFFVVVIFHNIAVFFVFFFYFNQINSALMSRIYFFQNR